MELSGLTSAVRGRWEYNFAESHAWQRNARASFVWSVAPAGHNTAWIETRKERADEVPL